jgi:hypothetical protein
MHDETTTLTRTAASVRNTKCLVQIQVTNVGTDQAWTRQADLCIHIGTFEGKTARRKNV